MQSLEEQIKNYKEGYYLYINVTKNNEIFEIPGNIEYLNVYIDDKSVKSFTIPKHNKFLYLRLYIEAKITFPEHLTELSIFNNIPNLKSIRKLKKF